MSAEGDDGEAVEDRAAPRPAKALLQGGVVVMWLCLLAALVAADTAALSAKLASAGILSGVVCAVLAALESVQR